MSDPRGDVWDDWSLKKRRVRKLSVAEAVRRGDCAGVEELLDAGWDVHERDAWGLTALHQALLRASAAADAAECVRYLRVANLLLLRGAVVSATMRAESAVVSATMRAESASPHVRDLVDWFMTNALDVFASGLPAPRVA